MATSFRQALLLVLLAALLGITASHARGDAVKRMLREQLPADYENSAMHIVFSSGCEQAHRLLFATVLQDSAARAWDKGGSITQLIAGCTLEQQAAIRMEPRFYYDFRGHFTPSYCHFVVDGRKVSKDWMTEMCGCSVAAANHGVKHTILTNLGIAHSYLDGHEYWSIQKDDNLEVNPCADPYEVALPQKPPAGLHYFHLYLLLEKGRYFNKHVIPKEVLKCDHEMLEIPKASEYDAVFPTYKDNSSYMARKRVEVWTECAMLKTTNRAIYRLKNATCATTGFSTSFFLEKEQSSHTFVSSSQKVHCNITFESLLT